MKRTSISALALFIALAAPAMAQEGGGDRHRGGGGWSHEQHGGGERRRGGDGGGQQGGQEGGQQQRKWGGADNGARRLEGGPNQMTRPEAVQRMQQDYRDRMERRANPGEAPGQPQGGQRSWSGGGQGGGPGQEGWRRRDDNNQGGQRSWPDRGPGQVGGPGQEGLRRRDDNNQGGQRSWPDRGPGKAGGPGQEGWRRRDDNNQGGQRSWPDRGPGQAGGPGQEGWRRRDDNHGGDRHWSDRGPGQRGEAWGGRGADDRSRDGDWSHRDRDDQRWTSHGGDRRWDGDRRRGDGGWHGGERRYRDRDHGRAWYDAGHWNHYYRAHQRYRAPAYRYPRNWFVYEWRYGDYLPRGWYDSYYYLDWSGYGLPYPPIGCEWVRVGSNALLIDIYTGEVLSVYYDLFW